MSINLSVKLQKILDEKSKNTGFDNVPDKIFDLDYVPKWIKRYIDVEFPPHGYQYEVVKWMTTMRLGGILNLDPGLGKTYISMLHANLTYSMCNLIVCNKSQLLVWDEEMKKFYKGRFEYRLAHKEYTKPLYDYSLDELEDPDFIITTYESITSAYKHDCPFQKMYWNNVYCDEVHRIRNPSTELYMMVEKIQRKRFWGLTGSLIHNEINDARSLQELIDPDSVYSLHNIKTLRLEDVDIHLPELHKHYIYTEFTEKQQYYYSKYELAAEELLSTMNPRNRKTWGCIFAILTRLRQLAISPCLLEESHDIKFDDEEGYKSPRIESISEKIESTEEQGVVFCFFRKSLELIARNLRERGIRCKIIKSEHSAERKQHYIDRFRKGDYQVLLTTYKTGGLGFNLTNANHVYLCSLWWNMQVIQQAFKRCFRPGQIRETHVHFFMRKGSIEDRMLEICKQKVNLTDNFLMENYKPIKLSKDVLRMLF